MLSTCMFALLSMLLSMFLQPVAAQQGGSASDAQSVVNDYLSLFAAGNVSESQLLDESVILSWKGSPTLFPTLGGEWVGKQNVAKFYGNKKELFNEQKFRVEDIVVFGSDDNSSSSDSRSSNSSSGNSSVLVQYLEYNTIVETGYLFVLVNTVLFHLVSNNNNNNNTSTNSSVNSLLIDKIDIFLDTSEVLSAVGCSSPLLYCGPNGAGEHMRPSDVRFPKPIASAINNNHTLNKKIVQKYLTELSNKNVQAAMNFLATNVSLVFEASTVKFPMVGGVWSGKLHVEEFFSNMAKVFTLSTNISLSSISYLFAANNSVLVQYEETLTSLQTQRTHTFVYRVIFTLNEKEEIADIDMFLDTSVMLDVVLCTGVKGVQTFSCTPFRPDHREIVKGYLYMLQQGNMTGMYEYLNDASALSYRSLPFVSSSVEIVGSYISKKEIKRFYDSFFQVFERSSFVIHDIVFLASEASTVCVQYVEHNTARQTKRSYDMMNTVVFDMGQGESINNIEIYLDSANVMSTAVCMSDKLVCTYDNNKVARVSESRAGRSEPSVLNSNITLNKKAAMSYLTLINDKQFDLAIDTLLSVNVSFAWQGNTTYFALFGGTWKTQSEVKKFYQRFAEVFDLHNISSSLTDFAFIAAENNIVVVQYYEHNKVKQTNRSYHETNTVIFTFEEGGMINDIEIWVNTAAVLDAMICKGTNLTCASDSSSPASDAGDSKLWIAAAGGICVLLIGIAAYAYFRFKHHKKEKAGLHEGLLREDAGTLN